MLPNADSLIKDLPDAVCFKIAEKLDSFQKPNWKTLISKMPKNLYDERAILKFHMAILKPRGSPTLALLTDLGRRKKTVGQLIGWMKELGTYSELIYFLENGEDALKELSPSIRIQPESVTHVEGSPLTLTIEASGKLPLKYQWFKGNYELREQTNNILHLTNLSCHDSGYYICRVANDCGFTFTDWCKVNVLEQNSIPSYDACSAFNTPLITMHPRSLDVQRGSELHLYADAVCEPSPMLQWYHNDRPLLGECSRELVIPYTSSEHEGFYHLEASNKYTRVNSLKAQIKVLTKVEPVYFTTSLPTPEISFAASDGTKAVQSEDIYLERGQMGLDIDTGVSIAPPSAPSDKIALVIGNQNYVYRDKLGHLVHPVNDAHDIAAELRSMDFKVVSLVNLNVEDMRNAVKFFSNLLDNGTYALFYFAGHGFEVEGESYMMAVDASDKYLPQENLSLSEVLPPIKSKNPKLSVLLIDSCRTDPVHCRQDPILKSPHQNVLQRKNVTVCFGCCARGRVLESPLMRNGYFAHHLLENIASDVKIDDVLFNVAKGIHEDHIVDPVTGRTQVVYRHTTVVDELRLTDKKLPTNKPSQQLLSWQHAHVAPVSPVTVLENDHVVVNLIFTPEFSNCLLIQSQIMEKVTCTSRNVLFILPQSIGGAQVETVSPQQKGKGIKLNEKIVRISNIEQLEGDIDIHLEVTYEIDELRHQQRAFYCIKEKPLYAKITEDMKKLDLSKKWIEKCFKEDKVD